MSNLDKLPAVREKIGDMTGTDKKIYISQSVYDEIHEFASIDTSKECGGILAGEVIKDGGVSHIVVRAFIEAKHSEKNVSTLKFTHQSWEYIHSVLDKDYPDLKIVGWIHTHPAFGIFLSEYDLFIENNFFNAPDNIAFVVDPIQNIEGMFIWVDGKTARAPGYALFGEKEKKSAEKPASAESAVKPSGSLVGAVKPGNSKGFVPVIILGALLLAALVVILIQAIKIGKLETELQIVCANQEIPDEETADEEKEPLSEPAAAEEPGTGDGIEEGTNEGSGNQSSETENKEPVSEEDFTGKDGKIVTDNTGTPYKITYSDPLTDQSGNPVTGEDGKPVYMTKTEPETDDRGLLVFENGSVIYVRKTIQLNENGEPIKDENNNYIYLPAIENKLEKSNQATP